MTKKKIEQLIDEKVNEKVRAVMQVRAPFEATMQGVTNMLVLIQAAAMNKAQRQEIREQLDGIKWRLVEIEDELRRQPKVRIYWAPATAEQIAKSRGKRAKATK